MALAANAPDDKISVLIVDDSVVVRGILRKTLESDPDIVIADAVGNGQVALDLLSRKNVDVVILDIEMPVMDGLTALPLILKKQPGITVIVASTLTLKNADISFKCLQLGAKDYIPKPTNTVLTQSTGDFKTELIYKIKNLSRHKVRKRTGAATSATGATRATPQAAEPQPAGPLKLRPFPARQPMAVAIGSSTGGPQALLEIFKTPPKIKQPIFIAQHMPPVFTESLAQHLERLSGWTCHEGRDGEMVKGGQIYIAPGNFHMTVMGNQNDPMIKLNQNPPETFCRPSVNPLLRSVIDTYEGRVLCVMLTGLGNDGLEGAKYFVTKGGALLAQDEETSVIWGMPGAVATAGLCSAVLPLSKISQAIETICNSIVPNLGLKL